MRHVPESSFIDLFHVTSAPPQLPSSRNSAASSLKTSKEPKKETNPKGSSLLGVFSIVKNLRQRQLNPIGVTVLGPPQIDMTDDESEWSGWAALLSSTR